MRDHSPRHRGSNNEHDSSLEIIMEPGAGWHRTQFSSQVHAKTSKIQSADNVARNLMVRRPKKKFKKMERIL